MLKRLTKVRCDIRIATCLAVAAIGCSAVAQDAPPASYAGRSVEQWLGLLADNVARDTPEGKERTRRAAQALGSIGPPAKAAVPMLAQALQSSSIEVRHFAVDALGRIGPEAASSVPAILQEVDIPKDHRFYVPLTQFRRFAAHALGRMGPPAAEAVPVLQQAVRDENEDVLYRVEAALAIWRINRDELMVRELKSLIALDRTQGVFEAVIALGQMGDDAKPAATRLQTALHHEQADVRRAAARVLLGFGPEMLLPLTKEMVYPETKDRRPPAFAVGELFDQIREDVLYGDQLDDDTREAVNLAAGAFARMLASDNESDRQVASRALSQMGFMGIGCALDQVGSEIPAVRAAAARTLIRIEPNLPRGPSANVEELKPRLLQLLQRFMRHQDPQVQAAAFRIFAELDFGDAGSEAIPLLRNALRNPDVAIRRHAAKALKKYEDE